MSGDKPNIYSKRWFDLFHVGIPEERTELETDFICKCAPLESFRKICDLCCGMGRHARGLSRRGYLVTGVERNSQR
jgi:2-polyprenyl-3-methyl-5-hydroxy-6-metoxy-1,4-benzoquinol methylase